MTIYLSAQTGFLLAHDSRVVGIYGFFLGTMVNRKRLIDFPAGFSLERVLVAELVEFE